jgi:hypothetical protein
VKIDVTRADTTLRPGMTTANAIETASVANVLSIPLEAVVNEAGYQYAYKKSGARVVKQMIETGVSNDNEIIVRRGLSKDDRVLLVPPTDKADVRGSSPPLRRGRMATRRKPCGWERPRRRCRADSRGRPQRQPPRLLLHQRRNRRAER